MDTVHVEPGCILGPVPAWRGFHLGDSPLPLNAKDVARLRAETGATCIRLEIEPAGL